MLAQIGKVGATRVWVFAMVYGKLDVIQAQSSSRVTEASVPSWAARTATRTPAPACTTGFYRAHITSGHG